MKFAVKILFHVDIKNFDESVKVKIVTPNFSLEDYSAKSEISQLEHLIRISDPEKSYYRIGKDRKDVEKFIEAAVKGVVRSIVGNQLLDEVQSNREHINEEIKKALSVNANEWGVIFTRTEITDVDVDEKTKDAQRQEIEAERRKRAQILDAEGKRREIEQIADGKKREVLFF